MEQADPSKFIVLTELQKKVVIGASLLIVLVVLPLFVLFYYNWAINRPAQSFKDHTFYIEDGETLSSIARRLGEQGVVNSEFLFKFYLYKNKLQSKIQAGVYTIPSGTSVKKLSEIFQFGTNDLKLTFLEGWRMEEYARLASSVLKKSDYGEFVKLAKSKEGMLFPDTYYFNVDSTEKDIVSRLISNFEAKTNQLFLSDAFKKTGLTKAQVITLASIVEREVSREEDRPIVAGVLIKRFLNEELIGADATVQYLVAEKNFCKTQDNIMDCPDKDQIKLIDWWPLNITKADLETESPFNTRKNIGLPPTPISNPGISAIESVINFTPTTYNYYLTDKNGITHFSNTLEEHNQNIASYLQ
ncbi:endolytic transglycosylase MltG [candidate division WWE3 bacterium]|nr:endolytic transglycosylase MltG [candidate division WWE3 bacterium]